jgi:hypothetical protein
VIFLGGVLWVGFCALVDDAGKTASRAPEPQGGEVIIAREPPVVAPEPAPQRTDTIDAGRAVALSAPATSPRFDTTIVFRDSNGLVAGQSVDLQLGDLSDGGAEARGTANVMGLAHIPLSVGRWKVLHPLTSPGAIEVTDAGQSFTLLVRQKTNDEKRVAGVVTDSKGKPVDNASIFSDENPEPIVHTKPDGTFSFLTDDNLVVVRAVKDANESAPERVRPGGPPARLWLADGALVRLHFSDQLDEAWVRAEIGTDHADWLWKQDEAHFMPRGLAIVRARHHTGRRLLVARTVVRVPTQGEVAGSLTFEPGPDLQLRAIDSKGLPVQNVPLSAYRADRVPDTRPFAVQIDAGGRVGEPLTSCLTATDGTCELTHLPLTGFDDLIRIEAAPPWHVTRNQLAKLFDAPITIEVQLQQ